MRKGVLVILTFFILMGFSTPKRENDKIIYVFPDEVEVSLNEYIQRINKKHDKVITLTLYKLDNGVFKVYVNNYERSKRSLINSLDQEWSESTNRYAIVNNKEYPLLFDYDYNFGTNLEKGIGEFGQREGQVLRIISLNDGFSIKFTKAGIVKNEIDN